MDNFGGKFEFSEFFSYHFQNLNMKMMEFFNFVNGFEFPTLFLIFWWANGQLWGKIRIFGIFFVPFSKFEYEDDGIFQFCKRIRIPHIISDFVVGEWTTLGEN